MENSNNGSAVVVVVWLLTILILIGSGVLAWSIVDPDSFVGVIGFLILWAIFSKVGHFVGLGIASLFSR